jgi:hypothetical protein
MVNNANQHSGRRPVDQGDSAAIREPREALIKPSCLRTAADHGTFPARLLSSCTERR